MGTSPSASPLPQSTYITMDYKYCKVWIRKIDKVEQMEEYPIYIQTQQQYDKYKQMFVTRMEHQNFPKTLYFIAGTGTSCGGGERGSILIQRIPYRLCQLANIAPNEALSFIYFALHGFRSLYSISGLFRIKTTMLGFDRKFRLKLWHHTDLSNPNPQDPYCQSMVDMIQSIIRSIESISRKSATKPKFNKYVQSRNICLFSFEIAIKMVEQYASEFGIKLANQFEAIRKYIRAAQGKKISNTSIFSTSNSEVRSYSKNSHSSRKDKNHNKTNSSMSSQSSKSSLSLIPNVNPPFAKQKTKNHHDNIYYGRTNEVQQSNSSISSNRSRGRTSSKNSSSYDARKANKSSRQISQSLTSSRSSNKENYADKKNDPMKNCKPDRDRVLSRSSLTSLQNNSLQDSSFNFQKPSKIIQKFNKNLKAPNKYESMLRNSNISDQSYLPFSYLTSSKNQQNQPNRNLHNEPYKQSNLRAGSTSAQSIPSNGSIEFGVYQKNMQSFGGLNRLG